MKVLLVDDSDIVRAALKGYLTSEGHEIVAQADNGYQAIELFAQTDVDLVTMDITMPGISGLDTLKGMLAQKPDTKIIVVSAVTDKNQILDALSSGAKYYLRKPFTKKDLMAALEHINE